MLKLLFFFLSITTYSSQRSVVIYETLTVNSNHQSVRWNHFPISFYFDPAFPKDKKLLFIKETEKLNRLVGEEVIHLFIDKLPPNDDDDDSNYNLITISRPDDEPFELREEAKTITVESHDRLINASIFYNPRYMRPDYDFASITRHELCHALGIHHIGTGSNGLMSPLQEQFQVKEWDEKLLEQWKREMTLAE